MASYWLTFDADERIERHWSRCKNCILVLLYHQTVIDKGSLNHNLPVSEQSSVLWLFGRTLWGVRQLSGDCPPCVMCHMWEETRSCPSMSSVNMRHMPHNTWLPTLGLHSSCYSTSTYVSALSIGLNPHPDQIFCFLCQETSLSSIKDALEHTVQTCALVQLQVQKSRYSCFLSNQCFCKIDVKYIFFKHPNKVCLLWLMR